MQGRRFKRRPMLRVSRNVRGAVVFNLPARFGNSGLAENILVSFLLALSEGT